MLTQRTQIQGICSPLKSTPVHTTPGTELNMNFEHTECM